MDVLGWLLTDDEAVQGQADDPPDPAWLGARMAALYGRWAGPEGVDLPAITEGFLDRLERRDTRIGDTCLRAADAVSQWGGYPYHSNRHHAEVATNVMMITELAGRVGAPVPSGQRALLLAGSLAHDIYYQPGAARFAAETISAGALDEIAARAGLDADERAALSCLILATEPGFRASLANLANGSGHVDLPPGLAGLAEDAGLAGLAAMLSDADLLSSAGLTQAWHDVQVARLESELACHIPPAADMGFLDGVVGPDFLSPGGRMFSANLARIRAVIDGQVRKKAVLF